ncbi:MAG TPA: haloacid dehalogenase type II [Steroidobacteraceae bacterium]|jgi:2-haloalkanoic acid dehalogenase type II|nr:haloacid dehalogenase type II [Steroidobacteraceae bacterium]
MRLHDFKALTFDCYGTLVDWESGLWAALQPLLARAELGSRRDEVLAQFGRHEAAQQALTPAMLYPQLLAEVHRQLAEDWEVKVDGAAHEAFGRSIPQWPAFPDTAEALRYLKRHYKLVILSNVDRASFAASNGKLGVDFDLICTAQDIGSYKPDARNFRYLIEAVGRLGIGPRQILHTAQSLYHDHTPAQAAGLKSAWIDRRHEREGWGATRPPEGTPVYNFRFTSMGEMAQAHAAESAA